MQVGQVRARSRDDDGGRGLGGLGPGALSERADAFSAQDALHAGQGIHRVHRGGGFQVARLGVDRHFFRVDQGSARHGGSGGDADLEFVVAGPRIGVEVEDDQQVGAARFLKLADHELADARRGAPVDGAPVVAGHVLAQGVEGHVRGGQVLRGRTLDVADKTDR